MRVPCRLCAQTFTTHEGMVVHAGRVHSGDRTQKCRFCPHTLKKSKKAMQSHEMTKHYDQWIAQQHQNAEMDS